MTGTLASPSPTQMRLRISGTKASLRRLEILLGQILYTVRDLNSYFSEMTDSVRPVTFDIDALDPSMAPAFVHFRSLRQSTDVLLSVSARERKHLLFGVMRCV